MAWTAAGGEILTIEAVASRGSGKLSLTGNLGKVMSESATIALEYVKAHWADLKLHPLIFKYWDIFLGIATLEIWRVGKKLSCLKIAILRFRTSPKSPPPIISAPI